MCCLDFDPFKITSASNITQIPHVVRSIDRASHCRQPVGPVFPCSASSAHSFACRFPPRQARMKSDPRVQMLSWLPCGECLLSVGSQFSHALMSSVWNTVCPYLSPSVLLVPPAAIGLLLVPPTLNLQSISPYHPRRRMGARHTTGSSSGDRKAVKTEWRKWGGGKPVGDRGMEPTNVISKDARRQDTRST